MRMENWQLLEADNQAALANHISLPIPPASSKVAPEPETDWFGEELDERGAYWYDHFDFVPDDSVEDYVNNKWAENFKIESYEDAIEMLEGQGFELVNSNGKII